MIDAHIGAILLATGAITALPILQFLAPGPLLKVLYKLEVRDRGGLFFARHWGLVAFSMGVLLLWAAGHPAVRRPVVAAALIEKAGLVALIAAQWREPHTQGMRLTLAFDATCVLLYGAWLLGA